GPYRVFRQALWPVYECLQSPAEFRARRDPGAPIDREFQRRIPAQGFVINLQRLAPALLAGELRRTLFEIGEAAAGAGVGPPLEGGAALGAVRAHTLRLLQVGSRLGQAPGIERRQSCAHLGVEFL